MVCIFLSLFWSRISACRHDPLAVRQRFWIFINPSITIPQKAHRMIDLLDRADGPPPYAIGLQKKYPWLPQYRIEVSADGIKIAGPPGKCRERQLSPEDKKYPDLIQYQIRVLSWQIYRSWILCTMLCRRGAFFAGFALTHRDNDDRRDAIVLLLPKSSLLHLFHARAVADLLFAKAAKRCSFRNAWIGSFEHHSFLP